MFIESGNIPYLKDCPKDGRMRPLITCFDGKEWHNYIQHQDKKIIDFKFVDYISGVYLAKGPAKDIDIEIPLLTFLFQHIPTTETFNAFFLLNSDLENALAVLQKQFILFHHFRNNNDNAYARIISTEMEYALFNHRSAYDLLNRLSIVFLERYGDNRNKVPDSFRRVAEKSDKERLAYGFPPLISNFYTEKQKKFTLLRTVRDAIVHHGLSIDLIFKMPAGFGISGGSLVGKKLKEGGLWDLMKPIPNDVGSSFAFFAFLADDLFVSLADFTKAFTHSFKELPRETAPGYRIYSRSPLSKCLNLLPEYLANPWCMDKTN